MARDQYIHVVINSPDKLIWEGRADSVSSENSAGIFDILPEHANFITMIQDKDIVVRGGTNEQVFHYSNAVLTVKKGIVTVYADI